MCSPVRVSPSSYIYLCLLGRLMQDLADKYHLDSSTIASQHTYE